MVAGLLSPNGNSSTIGQNMMTSRYLPYLYGRMHDQHVWCTTGRNGHSGYIRFFTLLGDASICPACEPHIAANGVIRLLSKRFGVGKGNRQTEHRKDKPWMHFLGVGLQTQDAIPGPRVTCCSPRNRQGTFAAQKKIKHEAETCEENAAWWLVVGCLVSGLVRSVGKISKGVYIKEGASSGCKRLPRLLASGGGNRGGTLRYTSGKPRTPAKRRAET
jgi:hypothetical protein